MKHKKCGILLAFPALLIAAWVSGNLLLDVQLPGESGYRDQTPLPAPSGNTLREVFEDLPQIEDPGRGAEKTGTLTRIELLEENPRAWAARWRLLGEARRNLDISYFILKGDVFGMSFLGHLLQKAREGVHVRILLDAMGTRLARNISGNDYLDALAANANVSVKMYRPLVFRYTDLFLTFNPAAVIASDHDKILIADGRLALLGGRNIGSEYFADPADDPKAFYDADVLLHGKEAGSALSALFDVGFESGEAHDLKPERVDIVNPEEDLLLAYEAMDAWLRGKPFSENTVSAIRDKGLSWLEDLEKLPRLRGALEKKSASPTAAEVRLLDSRPRTLSSRDPIGTGLEGLARSAEREIFIQSPYLVLSRKAVSVLEEAAARGVRITVLTNSPVSSDNALSQAFFLDQWPELLAHVPTLRLFVAGDKHNLHSKLGVIDGRLALVGTYNMDPLSMALDGELVAAVWSERFADRLLRKPRHLISGGPARTYEYRIRRDGEGRPVRDRKGKVEVAFGPDNHSAPEEWKAVGRYRVLLRIAKILPGSSKLLRGKS